MDSSADKKFTLNHATPKYLIRDRNPKYNNVFTNGVKNLGIKLVVTSYRSSWQNSYAEWVTGSIKRERHDNEIILNEEHLRIVLSEYVLTTTNIELNSGSTRILQMADQFRQQVILKKCLLRTSFITANTGERIKNH